MMRESNITQLFAFPMEGIRAITILYWQKYFLNNVTEVSF